MDCQKVHLLYEQLLDRFCCWASQCDDVRMAFVVGSRARTETPADQWSDLDIVMIVKYPQKYIRNTDWLSAIGNYGITFIENTAVGNGQERRILFESGLDVDFSIVSPSDLVKILQDEDGQAVLQRGFRLLLDKDHLADSISLPSMSSSSFHLPTREQFDHLVNDFWYHAVWTGKKMARGELWIAKSCVDGYMKRRLRTLIEWHTCAHVGSLCDVWHAGRFLDQWADKRIVAELTHAFAHYSADDVRRALRATMHLFRWIALEVAGKLELTYPQCADDQAEQLVQILFDNMDKK